MGDPGQTSGTSTPAPIGGADGAGRERRGAHDGRDTTRPEAFSDGVFAIAITLLVLTFKVPPASPRHSTLFAALRDQWPAYLAYANSFFAILIQRTQYSKHKSSSPARVASERVWGCGAGT